MEYSSNNNANYGSGPDRSDPYLSFNFQVEIDGIVVAGFTEISGLDIEIEYHNYYEGGGAGMVYHLPYRPKYGNVVLSKGLGDDAALFQWVIETAQGSVKPKQISIFLKDAMSRQNKARWDLANALPNSWKSGAFNAMHSRVAIESLSLVFMSITRVVPRAETIQTTSNA